MNAPDTPATEPTPAPTVAEPEATAPEAAASGTAPDATAVEPAAASAPASAPAEALSPAACAERLKALFPALFAGQAKPIKLRIQADIQARVPGEFSKAQLSAFLRRHTGSTGYLIALTRAPARLDLDGQPAGEISEEHRQAANEELARRRALHEQRRQAERQAERANAQQQRQQEQAEEQARRERYQLMRAFDSTTLTRENFCALKGLAPEALDALLAQARQEAAEWAQRAPQRPPREGRPGDGRPHDHRSREGRPHDGRPREGRPQDNRPRGPRTGDDRPRSGRPPRGEQPKGPR
ncbi:MAG: ProQ/FinO family protein [Burkholderiaceae bacterium]